MREIDGAKTLLVGKAKNGEFGFVNWFDGSSRKIEYLSINQYENSNKFYLFFLSEQFETLSDYVEDSLDELKEMVKQFFPNVNITWETFE